MKSLFWRIATLSQANFNVAPGKGINVPYYTIIVVLNG
jgi:hypothetical protein